MKSYYLRAQWSGFSFAGAANVEDKAGVWWPELCRELERLGITVLSEWHVSEDPPRASVTDGDIK